MDGERLASDADQDILASGWNEWILEWGKHFNIFPRQNYYTTRLRHKLSTVCTWDGTWDDKSSLEREHMSRRPGTVGQIVIQAPRIAVDVELQSGHARSHQCETSSSIIALPGP